MRVSVAIFGYYWNLPVVLYASVWPRPLRLGAVREIKIPQTYVGVLWVPSLGTVKQAWQLSRLLSEDTVLPTWGP